MTSSFFVWASPSPSVRRVRRRPVVRTYCLSPSSMAARWFAAILWRIAFGVVSFVVCLFVRRHPHPPVVAPVVVETSSSSSSSSSSCHRTCFARSDVRSNLFSYCALGFCVSCCVSWCLIWWIWWISKAHRSWLLLCRIPLRARSFGVSSCLLTDFEADVVALLQHCDKCRPARCTGVVRSRPHVNRQNGRDAANTAGHRAALWKRVPERVWKGPAAVQTQRERQDCLQSP